MLRTLRLVNLHPLIRISLGQQAVEIPFQVVVTDVRGNSFPNARVTASVNGRTLYDVSTDVNGSASFPLMPGSQGAIDVRIEADGYIIRRKVENTDETLFVSLPICASQPFLTMTEMVIMGTAGALVGAGTYFKVDVVKMLGEIGLGAGVFSAVYRHSCGG